MAEKYEDCKSARSRLSGRLKNRRTECSRICRINAPEKDTETGKFDIDVQDLQDGEEV